MAHFREQAVGQTEIERWRERGRGREMERERSQRECGKAWEEMQRDTENRTAREESGGRAEESCQGTAR